MATRSRTSFQKRQKEIARMEKQRDKAARRVQRKLAPAESEDSEYVLGEDGLPILGEDGQPILNDEGQIDDAADDANGDLPEAADARDTGVARDARDTHDAPSAVRE